jgi:hypothetical protein
MSIPTSQYFSRVPAEIPECLVRLGVLCQGLKTLRSHLGMGSPTLTPLVAGTASTDGGGEALDTLLDTVYTLPWKQQGSEESFQTAVHLLQVNGNGVTQAGVVHAAVAASVVHHSENLIALGHRHRRDFSRNQGGAPNLSNIESFFPNSVTLFLSSEPWRMLLTLIGETRCGVRVCFQ